MSPTWAQCATGYCASRDCKPPSPRVRGAGGEVYSTSSVGRVFAFDAAVGKKPWEYQATPGLYVFSDPVPADGVVYITGMDGSLTALRAAAKSEPRP